MECKKKSEDATNISRSKDFSLKSLATKLQT